MNLLTNSDELFSSRAKEIKQLLKPLSNNRQLWINSLPNQGSQIFTVSDVVQGFATDFSTHRFQTVSEQVTAAYFEVWLPSDRSHKNYYLKNSYLHLYCQEPEYLFRRPNGELLLIHTDPNIASNEPHYYYKIRTHLHFQDMPYDLNHAHIALDLNVENLYDSRDNFNRRLSRSFLMIKEQILDVILIA